MPEIVDPEITDPVNWVVEYKIPFEILQDYFPVRIPSSGVEWKANLYKCGDKTSHPHWLTWSGIDLAQPDFHQPIYFGTLVFE